MPPGAPFPLRTDLANGGSGSVEGGDSGPPLYQSQLGHHRWTGLHARLTSRLANALWRDATALAGRLAGGLATRLFSLRKRVAEEDVELCDVSDSVAHLRYCAIVLAFFATRMMHRRVRATRPCLETRYKKDECEARMRETMFPPCAVTAE